MIRAQWVNSECTTLEVTWNGVTSYLTMSPEGLRSQDGGRTAEAVQKWREEGNEPLPYYNGG